MCLAIKHHRYSTSLRNLCLLPLSTSYNYGMTRANIQNTSILPASWWSLYNIFHTPWCLAMKNIRPSNLFFYLELVLEMMDCWFRFCLAYWCSGASAKTADSPLYWLPPEILTYLRRSLMVYQVLSFLSEYVLSSPWMDYLIYLVYLRRSWIVYQDWSM